MNQLREISPNAEEFEYLKIYHQNARSNNGKPAELNEEEWKSLENLIKEALAKFVDFRKTEGNFTRRTG